MEIYFHNIWKKFSIYYEKYESLASKSGHMNYVNLLAPYWLSYFFVDLPKTKIL